MANEVAPGRGLNGLQRTMADILTVSHLQKSFGHLKAVDDLSFEVKEGEILGMMGPNGAGKTTVFNLLTGVIHTGQGNDPVQGKRRYPCFTRQTMPFGNRPDVSGP